MHKTADVLIEFDLSLHPDNPGFLGDISAVKQFGDDLWLGSDELTTVDRVTRIKPGHFAEHTKFPLSDYVELPADDSEEVDIEGLDIDGHYLWVTGSHSLKRSKAKSDKPKKAIKSLAEMERETNRYLLARIPILPDPDTGKSSLYRVAVDPEHPRRNLAAAQLFGTGKSNLLVDTLRDDPHLARFLSIPCKENGFDIEGLAACGNRLFLGLRGPVLGGWAIILELQVEPVADHLLTLKRIGPHGSHCKKHFLNLNGLGIRDVCRDGDDLLVLAGPTMSLDGHILLYRWPDALCTEKPAILDTDDLEKVIHFHFDSKREVDTNHAEGVTFYSDERHKKALLITFDNPSDEMQPAKHKLRAAVFA